MIKKNKPLTVLLLVVVVCIYGTILYRSFAKDSLVDAYVNKTDVYGGALVTNYLKDSFKTDFYLKDPFEGEHDFSSISPSQTLNTVDGKKQVGSGAAPQSEKPVLIKWPQIKYLGFVKNQEKNQGLFLVSIEDSLLKMSKGQHVKGVTLLNATRDSARFAFNGVEMAIAK